MIKTVSFGTPAVVFLFYYFIGVAYKATESRQF